jgi:hypothetical protein
MTADPLKELERISNPATYTRLEKGGKRIVLLGDIHTAKEGECPRCKLPKCANYGAFIDSLEEYHKATSTQLDVFVEVAAPEEGRLSRFYRTAGELFHKGFRHITGQALNLVNARGDLIKKLYFHGKDGGAQRYHYIDFRFTQLFKDYGFDLPRLLEGEALAQGDPVKVAAYIEGLRTDFVARYPTRKALVDTLKMFLFGRPFDPSYKQRERLSHGMTRIAKQFYKIESAADRKVVRSFALERIDALLGEKDEYKTTPLLHGVLLNLYALLTDIYAICRFIRYFHKQSAGSTSVFLAGVIHADNYRAFLKRWGAKEKAHIQTWRRGGQFLTRKVGKCIRLKRRRAAAAAKTQKNK